MHQRRFKCKSVAVTKVIPTKQVYLPISLFVPGETSPPEGLKPYEPKTFECHEEAFAGKSHTNRATFFFIVIFSIQQIIIKNCHCLDSNCGYLVFEATTLQLSHSHCPKVPFFKPHFTAHCM